MWYYLLCFFIIACKDYEVLVRYKWIFYMLYKVLKDVCLLVLFGYGWFFRFSIMHLLVCIVFNIVVSMPSRSQTFDK